jgi:dienelactone hydrolase
MLGVLIPTALVSGAPRSSALPSPRYPVGIRVLPIEDRSRATPADPEGQTPVVGSATRALPTTVLYPARGAPAPDAAPEVDAPARHGQFPLLLFSPGSPGTPADYEGLLRTWAAAGYVVAAPQYPVSSRAGPDDVTWSDQRDQVRDARFVLRQLLALDRVPVARGGLGGIVDREHIGAAGHSLGGLTTQALVSDCCRDPHVDAALVLAGVHDGEQGPAIRGTRGPILFVHATHDLAVRFSQGTTGYRSASVPKYLLEVRLPFWGVYVHVLPYEPGQFAVADRVAGVTEAFLDAYLRDEGGPAAIRAAASGDPELVLRARP